MTDHARNYVVGLLLLTLSVVWTWLVIVTIPAGFGDGDIGPRAFPLMFGLCLGFLSVILLLKSLMNRQKVETARSLATEDQLIIHWLPSALLLIELLGYGYLLKTVGFVISTPILVVFVMFINLRVRSVKMFLGMSIGITLVCWLVFEKVLGIYLANGWLINIG
ncbi:MAG: tripartite tricarboxylate transporter TctB family protein [Paracoccaceae bacterium]|jgi:putative tricarboxylic transport membrane protein|tara:strand:+ start:123 stop:614 length:492 start_codon:yes stop_codon:yes gene_type:complete